MLRQRTFEVLNEWIQQETLNEDDYPVGDMRKLRHDRERGELRQSRIFEQLNIAIDMIEKTVSAIENPRLQRKLEMMANELSQMRNEI